MKRDVQILSVLSLVGIISCTTNLQAKEEVPINDLADKELRLKTQIDKTLMQIPLHDPVDLDDVLDCINSYGFKVEGQGMLPQTQEMFLLPVLVYGMAHILAYTNTGSRYICMNSEYNNLRIDTNIPFELYREKMGESFKIVDADTDRILSFTEFVTFTRTLSHRLSQLIVDCTSKKI